MSTINIPEPQLNQTELTTLTQVLRVFAREMHADYQADRRDETAPEPPEIALQIDRLETIAATLDELESVDCTWAGIAIAARAHKQMTAFRLNADDWRSAASAVAYIAGQVHAAEDKTNAAQLFALSQKVESIARSVKSWHEVGRKIKNYGKTNG